MGRHSLLQGIFPTQGSNLGLLHGRPILYQLSYKGCPPPSSGPTSVTGCCYFPNENQLMESQGKYSGSRNFYLE